MPRRRRAATQVERNLKYRDLQRRRGLQQVQVWVPRYRVHEVKALATAWCEEHHKANGEY